MGCGQMVRLSGAVGWLSGVVSGRTLEGRLYGLGGVEVVLVSVVVVVGCVVVVWEVERFGLLGVAVPGVVGVVSLRFVGGWEGGVLVVGGQLVVLGCVGVGSDLGSVVVGCVSDVAVALAVGPRSVGVVVAGARCCGVGVCGRRWRRRL